MRIPGTEDNDLARAIGYYAGPTFVTDQIIPVPGGRKAPVIVLIDGLYYAGFHTRRDAKAAVQCWRGEVDGVGRPVEAHKGCHWSAISGKHVDIVGGGADA